MKGKIRYILLPFLVILLLPIGCGKKENLTSNVKLRLPYFSDVRNKPVGEAIIKAFQNAHPRIQIEPIFITGHYEQKVLTMIAGGDVVDLMVVFPFSMGDYVEKGTLLNLEPYMEKDEGFQSFKDDIYPASLEISKYKGIHYTVPFWANSIVLFYNKDLFDKEKIEYPDESWNWERLAAAGRKLTKIGENRKISQYGLFAYFGINDTFGGLYQYIRRNGGNLFNEDMSKCLIEDPESMEAIRWCFDLITKDRIVPSPFAGDERMKDYEQAFLSGKAAMTISGRWSVPLFSTAEFNWSCAPIPKGKVEFKPVGCNLMGAYSKTKHPEECWEFLKFITGKETQEIVSKLKSDIPIRISIANSPEFLNWSSRPKENKMFLEEMKNSKGFLHYFPGLKEWLEKSQQKLDLVLLGEKDLKVACEEIAKEYQEYRNK